ncbi:filamin A-interacting protein 1-like isoform X1 [Thunnus maccoyii]|uniref:filamin A-interacting protein 1-like isoform X1 n=1 Tax=Thunnus maccoyii TaxID=8240 RepID=UPI001C4B52A8|nr:filamin A-interacting protein 1-like isoform X1 [Thunnus maccoyii]
MHPLGKSSKKVSWNQGNPKKHNSEPSIDPIQPPKIPIQRDNRRDRREKWESRHTRGDLSRDDMLFLLSILEGELQARDEVITVLKSEKTDSALLGAHYGFSGLEKVLHALQRDSLRAQQDHLQDVYEKPIAELNNLMEAQKWSSTRMLEQFLDVSRSHSDALHRLEEQERRHRAFIHKSNCLTTLLEEDRERLKLLIVKEREYQEIKEKKSEREVSTLKEELTKLKAFALLVVKEQQYLSELLEEQRRCVKELTAIADHIKQEVSAAYPSAKEEEGLKSLHLEVEQHNQVNIFHQTQHTMTAKLVDDGIQNQQLRQQLVFLGHRFDDLEGTRGVLRRSDKELRELNEREMGTPSLLSEVEVLRRRVVEMEGKDEELIRIRDQCRELDRRLARETKHCCSLKVEVDKLSGRISELDRIEEALGKSKQDCSILKSSLEKERDVSKMLSGELDTLKVRVRELEAVESQLEKSEAVIRQDLAKLRSLTVALVDERKTMAERLRQAEEKLSRREGKTHEQSNLATMTERLRDERQQVLRCKAELEERIMGISKEKDELQARLTTEEERNGELQSKITIMKKRLQVLENKKEKEEKYMYSSIPNLTNHHCQTDNKVKELTQELDRLQKRLQDKEVLERELMKVEEDFKSLQRRFKDEQRRSKALTEELEVAKRELSGYQQAEKQEVNQEHLLLCRLQREQVKSRLLGREVDTLKEKLQELMGTEESICRVQTDHSTLQSKLTQQEARNKELAREMKELSSELDRYRQIKNLTSGANSQHYSDLYQTTKEVQTEPADSLPPDYSCQVVSVNNEKSDGENDDEDPHHNVEVINRRSSTLVNNLNSINSANNNISQYSSHSANGVNMHQTVNGEVMMLTHTPGQPLHIKVTPHHILNTATLEISSPTADTATSYTSTAVIPTSGASPKQRITIIQNSALPAVNAKTPPSSPDRTVSPLNGTPVTRMLSPNSSRSATPDNNNSPIQIVTVRTCSPEPTEVTSQAVFCKTPERQNSWQRQKSNSTDTSPSIITAEDNKIHIHLGSPYVQSLNGMTHSIPQPVGPYYLRHEQRTQVIANGCHVKGVGKITSSITISPATSPASHSSNITIPLGSLQKPGPTRIPKTKGYSTNRRGNRALNMGQMNGKPPAVYAGKTPT